MSNLFLILIGVFIVVVGGIYFISRKVSRKSLYTVSLVLSLICFSLVIYSIFVVRGWDGMGLGFVAISVLFGTWIGTTIRIFSKNVSA